MWLPALQFQGGSRETEKACAISLNSPKPLCFLITSEGFVQSASRNRLKKLKQGKSNLVQVLSTKAVEKQQSIRILYDTAYVCLFLHLNYALNLSD